MKAKRQQAGNAPLQADLFPLPAAPVRKIQMPVLAKRRQRSWLCVAFPDLALQAIDADVLHADRAAAVVQQLANRAQVLACNEAAAAQGVVPGLPVNAALALSPQLRVHLRDEPAEAVVLEGLISCCRQVTPVVSLAGESSLLLEVQGSLGLFGGLQALLAALRRALSGFRLQVASSPVAQASLWLVQAGVEWHLQDIHDSRLKMLPVSCLRWPDYLQQQFSRVGVTVLGDCLRLPRDGFAKRFGVARLQELDRGFARMPDIRNVTYETERFDSLLELPMETIDYPQIAAVLELQLDNLAEFLRQHQLAVQQFCIRVLQREFVVNEGSRNTQIEITIDLLDAQPGVHGLAELIALRFERVQLAAPVYALQLQTTSCVLLGATRHASGMTGADVFSGRLSTTDSAFAVAHAAVSPAASLQLVERLRQRLGYRCVYSLALKDDYRPECAWEKSEPLIAAEAAASYALIQRPLWLLPQPEALPVPEALSGHPERIQSGWWDGADMQRDYFRWQHRAGQHCWIYRDSTGWYLHGLFG